MNALLRGWRYAAVAALILGLPLAAACSAEEATGSGEDDNTEGATLDIEFPTMYSAFVKDGDHQFQIPAKSSVKKAKWTAEPKDAVQIDTQADGTVMITMKKFAETVKIKAKAGNLSGTAELHMIEATEEEWQSGQDRYSNGKMLPQRGQGDGGKRERPDGGWGKGDREKMFDTTLACTNCHKRGGAGGQNDVEHTPQQTGGYSDEELVNIFTKAEKPEGAEMHTSIKQEAWEKFHKWTMTEDEQKGIIVYLRSLTPEKQGELDWGAGIFGKGGKHGKGGKDKDKESKPADDDKDNEDKDAAAGPT